MDRPESEVDLGDIAGGFDRARQLPKPAPLSEALQHFAETAMDGVMLTRDPETQKTAEEWAKLTGISTTKFYAWVTTQIDAGTWARAKTTAAGRKLCYVYWRVSADNAR